MNESGRGLTFVLCASLLVGAAMFAVGILTGTRATRESGPPAPAGLSAPQRVERYSNFDGYPLIVRLCIGGAAFATVDGDPASGSHVIRVELWDDTYCGGTQK